MPPKTERFELRLDEDILSRIDQWRSRQSDFPARAEAMRRLVEVGLNRDSSQTVALSDGEKLILSMLCDLHKNLRVNGDGASDLIADAIYGGHFWALRWNLPGILHGHEDDPSNVTFVVNVLDMWSFIEEGFAALNKKEREALEKELGSVRFLGFDGNNESELLGIARFLIEKMGRFSSFKKRDLNSHIPTRTRYARMYSLFEPMRADLVGRKLSSAEITTLLQAKKNVLTAT